MKGTVTASLTSSIQTEFALSDKQWFAWIDKSEFEDAILNLLINAKHAMPTGGSLTVHSENIYLSPSMAASLNLAENQYIKLSINDTGSGIEQDNLEKIFEPFFSTKGQDGNGLGLSQVYGFIRRSGGAISVTSELGKGTQFDLYFPRYQYNDRPALPSPSITKHRAVTGNETILVVDDEPALRELCRQILQDAGYTVFTANDGAQALATLAENNNIALVLSDVVMPNMDGFTLAHEIKLRHPGIIIQLVSGFAYDQSIDDTDLPLANNMIAKPYSVEELLDRLQELLNKSQNNSHSENNHE